MKEKEVIEKTENSEEGREYREREELPFIFSRGVRMVVYCERYKTFFARNQGPRVSRVGHPQ